MNAEQIIREVVEAAGEWLEHAENPDAMVSGILANKIVNLQSYIEYLERRLSNVRDSAVLR
jgi:hypothetical protein